MRVSGHTFSFRSALSSAVVLTLCALGAAPSASAQTAPYVLPYTMSTFAGPHAQYTPGTACGSYVALDGAGDGCIASLVSVGIDPHDIRVDLQGNVYWLDDNNSTGQIHKINGQTTRMSIFVGSSVNTTASCPSQSTAQGDGCTANDGGGNVQKSLFTSKTPKARGLAVGNNGDLFYADFTGNLDHKVSAATGILSVVAGSGGTTGTAGYTDGLPGTTRVSSSRGIGVDAAGNVYVADTGNNAVRVFPANGTTSGSYTKLNTGSPAIKQVDTAVPANTAYLNAPEDVQIDSNGNIFIADAGNNVVRAIYQGRGTLPGITAPQTGYIYTIAGTSVSPAPASYPKDGTTPTVLATNISLSVRKLSLDTRNNLYIADSSNQVVWFVDALTGYIRILAGSYGGAVTAALSTPYGCAQQTNTLGDGCPASFAAITAVSDMGVAPDNQGNVYLTDAELGVAANSRLRKVLSGFNFPSVAAGTAVTQKVEIHFGPLDSPAAANAFRVTGTGSNTVDYTVALASPCTLQADTTTDCLLNVTFTPLRPGYDTATLNITSLLGGTNSYQLTGTGTASAITIDPGSVSVQNATVKAPQGVAVDGVGNIYTADTANNRVLFTAIATGTTTTFAGTGTAGRTGDGALATAALLNAPRAVTVDTSGNVFIADTGNNIVRRVNAAGIISTYAGGGTACATAFDALGNGCPATAATLNAPSGLTADLLGNLYIADTGNNVIRSVGTDGYIIPLAGGGPVCQPQNGTYTIDVYGDACNGTAALFKAPTALAYDNIGRNIIVADTGNNLIRSIFLGNTYTGTTASATATATAYTTLINPVSLVAGTGFAGSTLDQSSLATNSQLNAPTGVAIGAAQTIYIADTGNNAVRLVSPTTGTITTIIGVLGGTAGTGTVPGTASNVQLNAPSAVAVTPLGTLQIADSANNRILTDQRSQVTFQFGRTNVTFQSPLQNFIETNIGTSAATLPSPLLTNTPAQTQFTLVPAAGSQGCVPGTFAIGATCILQGRFTPATSGNFSATFTEVGTNTTTGDPAITLTGVGAILTTTTSTVAQTSPSTGNAQFGAPLTVTATITPASCNVAAPNCYPTGTVRFIVDNGNPGSPVTTAPNAAQNAATASQSISGLSVGSHTVSCNYSGDSFYAASSCGNTTIVVTTASTTSLLSVTNNNQPQFLANNCYLDTAPATKNDTICITSSLTATVVSNTVGIPTGNVTFFANGKSIGNASVNATTGVAVFNLTFERDPGYNLIYDATLPPGTYTLTCTYNGAANFSVSSCSGVTFTVAPQSVDFSLQTRGCSLSGLVPDGSLTPNAGATCSNTANTSNPTVVHVAQGSTSDVSIFVLPNNTVGGPITFSCSGLPHASTCTFSPTSVTLKTGTVYASPVAVNMTLWTDLQPGVGVAATHTATGISMASLLGWPLTLLGLAGLLRFRKAGARRGFALLALLLTMVGSTSMLSGCGSGGPGAYQPNLTPVGTYPITVTVTAGGVTHTTLVTWVVTAGITGQE